MKHTASTKKLSVFLAESMYAEDMYNGMLEGEALAQILRLLGVNVVYKIVTDAKRLRRAIGEARRGSFSVFHLSCHANADEFDLTSERDLTWKQMADMTGDHLGDIVLCLSACEAGNKAVAEKLSNCKRPPAYIVGPESQPGYAQTCVAWSVFYHALAKRGISRSSMRTALKRMNAAVDSDFLYRRWMARRYLRYPRAG